MPQLNRILFVVEPNLEPTWALQRARAFALTAQASLTLLMVTERVPAAGELTQDQVDEAIRRQCLDALEQHLADHEGRPEITLKVAFGRPHIEIIREVMRGGHELVIKAAEGRSSLHERLLGSRDMHLLRKCPCPVWLLKAEGGEHYRCILATVDFTPGANDEESDELNRRILDWASTLALAELAELHLVHAWEAPAAGLLRQWGAGVWTLDGSTDEYRYLEDMRNQHRLGLESLANALSERLGTAGFAYLAPQSHLPRGAAVDVIPALASELAADLIVMGTVGRGGIPGLLIGNTAETILNRCDCAVLTLKPPSFVSPVPAED